MAMCWVNIILAHKKEDAVPVGPSNGGPWDTTHQCSGTAGHAGEHYCGCGVSWNDAREILSAPWMERK